MKRTFAARLLTFHLSLLTLLASSSLIFAQGSIVPTTPPNVPIMKTLQQIEPRTDLKVLYDQNHDGIGDDTNYEIVISQPGSYYLSSNMGPTPSPAPMPFTRANGIHVTAAGVTLELNGFQISRNSGATGDGISIDQAADRCVIKNGSIAGFTAGIHCLVTTGYARGGSIVQVAVSGCTDYGIWSGDGWQIEGCKITGNSGTAGIFAPNGNTLTNCTVTGNSVANGYNSNGGSTFINCTAYGNIMPSGAIAIYSGFGSTLINCSAYGNTCKYGIVATQGTSLHNCSARDNNGIDTESWGMVGGSKTTFTSCTSSNNFSSAAPTSSTGGGIRAGDGATVKDCTSAFNKGDGILVTSNSLVESNNCDGNGYGGIGAGIHATGSANRIESNNTINNNTGVKVDAGGNLIIKNSSRGGSAAFTIATGNSKGEEINVYNPGATTIITSSNPWANFLY